MIRYRARNIEELIVTEIIFTIIIVIALIKALVNNGTVYLDKLQELDTVEKIEQFNSSTHYASNLHFDKISDTGEYIGIIDNAQNHEVKFEDIYGSLQGNKGMKLYKAYLLEREDCNIIFCSEIQKNVNLDVKNIRVSNKYKNGEISKEIINRYQTDNKTTYVFYSVPILDSIGFIIVTSVLLIIIIVEFILIFKSKRFKEFIKKINGFS